MKTKIWIEEQNYEDRTEFRVKLKGKYPDAIKREGLHERYLSTLVSGGNFGYQCTYVFTAYKKDNWFIRWFGNDYKNQTRIAIQACDKLIDEYKKDIQKPKITNYER